MVQKFGKKLKNTGKSEGLVQRICSKKISLTVTATFSVVPSWRAIHRAANCTAVERERVVLEFATGRHGLIIDLYPN